MSSRIGIIGSSKITERHIKTVESFPNTRLVGICGTYQPALRAISDCHDIPIVDSLDELLGQDPDWVVITTSSERHAECLHAVIPSSRRIIVEKPLTTTLADARSVAEFAERHGAKVFVVSQFRYDARFERLRDFVNGVAPPITARIDVKKKRDRSYYRGDSSVSKALVFSQLPHFLDMILELFGDEFTSVEATAEKVAGLSCFPDKLTACLTNERARIDLSIFVGNPVNAPTEFDLGCGEDALQTLELDVVSDPREPWWTSVRRRFRRRAGKRADEAFRRMYAAFFKAAGNNAQPSDELSRAVEVMALIHRLIDELEYFGDSELVKVRPSPCVLQAN